MNIFSEIYGAYFRIARQALLKAQANGSITEQEILDIVEDRGFSNSMLFVPDKLIPKKGTSESGWGLLRRNEDGTLSSILKNSPPGLLTLLQKRWLKALLADRRLRLFLQEGEYYDGASPLLNRLSERLAGVKPLYNSEDFRFFDVYADGDNYDSEEYRRFFRIILKAIKRRELVDITFLSPKNGEKRGRYLPLKLEYSAKNDKFRILCVLFGDNRPITSCTVNMGRITAAIPTGIVRRRRVDMARYYQKTRCKEPATVKVTSERKGIERFMAEFASYEKRSVFDMEEGTCTVEIWYDKQDETELLIQLLGFGPVLEILSPESVRQEAARRVERQYRLMFGEEENNKGGE